MHGQLKIPTVFPELMRLSKWHSLVHVLRLEIRVLVGGDGRGL